MWVGSCERKRENCEISHIDRTNKALTIYKEEQKLLSLCLCVEHREFKVTWNKSGGCLATCKGFDQPKLNRRHKAFGIRPAAPDEPDRWRPGIRRQPVARHPTVIGTGGPASDVRRCTGEPARNRHPTSNGIRRTGPEPASDDQIYKIYIFMYTRRAS